MHTEKNDPLCMGSLPTATSLSQKASLTSGINGGGSSSKVGLLEPLPDPCGNFYLTLLVLYG